MASLIDQILSEHGGDIAGQLSTKLGVPADKAAAVLPAVAPMILGGLQRQGQEGGAERVEHIVDKYGDDSILDDLGGFLSQKADEEDEPDPGLGGLLGDSGVQASNLIGNQLGIDKGTASKIIPMLAPIVLGYLMKNKNQAGGGAEGQGLIMGMIDQDGDGSILDDVAGMLGGGSGLGALLGGGGASQSQSSGGGMFGKILGSLLGGKK